MRIGYARVSTQDQNLDRQCDQLRQDGCERVYEEKVSGAKSDRPELGRMLDALREGDVVVVAELSRLSRSVRDLFDIVDRIDSVGAQIKSLKEPWLDTTTPHGRLLFTFFSGISEFIPVIGPTVAALFGVSIAATISLWMAAQTSAAFVVTMKRVCCW